MRQHLGLDGSMVQKQRYVQCSVSPTSTARGKSFGTTVRNLKMKMIQQMMQNEVLLNDMMLTRARRTMGMGMSTDKDTSTGIMGMGMSHSVTGLSDNDARAAHSNN